MVCKHDGVLEHVIAGTWQGCEVCGCDGYHEWICMDMHGTRCTSVTRHHASAQASMYEFTHKQTNVLWSLQYVSKAVAHKVIAARRAEVHDRYLKFWAKKVLVSPEVAVVPLKQVDYQLASRFEVSLMTVEYSL